MNNKSQQIEFDVFPRDNKSDYAYLGNIRNDTVGESTSINVVFSYQSVIIICICAIMLLVASFTLGVEKGKLLAKNSISAQKESLDLAGGVSAVVAAAPEKIPGNIPVTNLKTQTLLAGTRSTDTKKEITLASNIPAALTETTKEESTLKAGGYTIQIASVKNENGAKAMMDFLSRKGLTSSTKQVGKYIIVLAGNFSKREEAQVKLRELKKTYTDCFIKKI